MIEIQDLSGLNEEKIIALLLQESQPFNIYIPKETQKFFSEREEISNDYANLAYAGQRLKSLSGSFEYEKVNPEDHESVLFTITTNNIPLLAETLLSISYGYVNDHSDEDFLYFDLVDDFLDQVADKSIIPACPYFIKIFQEFQKDDE